MSATIIRDSAFPERAPEAVAGRTDPLAPARGIIAAMALSVPLWTGIILAVRAALP